MSQEPTFLANSKTDDETNHQAMYDFRTYLVFKIGWKEWEHLSF
ncbi:hypothetical protein MED217_09997 [Leeuwenhoekiella blandensis MED217]|uniref:Uncharacterized protein n=1 Tax=Leeuwenhoekiella blandensis (strain CECT 7118 / CCUG 51940 / KCTC 22103 / MED217) TaxID=398720 RepID=A3XNK1_LEEBM|nr:hypothetical protein MED217_09997 [Leeuwenhoekiella blandensis MED217]